MEMIWINKLLPKRWRMISVFEFTAANDPTCIVRNVQSNSAPKQQLIFHYAFIPFVIIIDSTRTTDGNSWKKERYNIYDHFFFFICPSFHSLAVSIFKCQSIINILFLHRKSLKREKKKRRKKHRQRRKSSSIARLHGTQRFVVILDENTKWQSTTTTIYENGTSANDSKWSYKINIKSK